MSYYTTIEGKRYDRKLLEKAESMLKGRGDGRISAEEAQQLFEMTKDHAFITPTELRTLRYVIEHFNITGPAREWLWEKMKRETPTQRVVKSILREIFNLNTMNWVVEDAVVEEHESLYENLTSFPVAFREMIEEFLTGGESGTSLRDIVAKTAGISPEDDPALREKILEWMNQGTLYLFPPDFLERIENGDLPFPYPPFAHDIEEYWPFGLKLPALRSWWFFGFVGRRYWWDVYHLGVG